MIQLEKQMQKRVEKYSLLLFKSELTIVSDTIYEVNVLLADTYYEKAKLAKKLALMEIERDLAAARKSWFSRKKVQLLETEKKLLHDVLFDK